MDRRGIWEQRRRRLYSVVETGNVGDAFSRGYDVLLVASIVINLAVCVAYTFDSMELNYGPLLLTVERVTVTFFAGIVCCIILDEVLLPDHLTVDELQGYVPVRLDPDVRHHFIEQFFRRYRKRNRFSQFRLYHVRQMTGVVDFIVFLRRIREDIQFQLFLVCHCVTQSSANLFFQSFDGFRGSIVRRSNIHHVRVGSHAIQKDADSIHKLYIRQFNRYGTADTFPLRGTALIVYPMQWSSAAITHNFGPHMAGKFTIKWRLGCLLLFLQ